MIGPRSRDVAPTAQFATLVYGTDRVPEDDPAEALHEASRLYPSVAPARLAVMTELECGGDLLQTVDRASRTHDHRPGIDLPAGPPLRSRFGDLVRRRRSRSADVQRPLRLPDLAAVLGAGYRAVELREGLSRRPVPSGGALYPLELYVLALSVEGLDPGRYHYNPYRHRLELLGALSWPDAREALVDQRLLDGAVAIVVVTAMFWRSRLKYGARGYRFALLEAGHLGQNLVLASTALDLPVLPLGGFYDRVLDRLVGADGLDEATVHGVLLGGAR